MDNTEEKKKTLTNFKKAKTHLEKIISMIEADEYCIDIMQQNLAVIGLLRSAHEKLMRNHLKTCFKEAFETEDDQKKQKMIDEMLTVTRLFNK